MKNPYFFLRILLLLFAAILLSAGELENFEGHVDFIKNAYKMAKKERSGTELIEEFNRRTSQALALSFQLQQSAEKLGIKKVSLDTTLRKMVRSMGIARVGAAQLTESESEFNRAYNDLHNQIQYLKEINYSYESGTCDAPAPELSTYDALHYFQGIVTGTYRNFAKHSYFLSRKQVEGCKKNFEDIIKVAREIQQKIIIDKLKLPAEANLMGHTRSFITACMKMAEIRSNQNNYRKRQKAKSQLKNSKEFQNARGLLDYSARQLKIDLETLYSLKFRLRIDKRTLSAVYKSTSHKQNQAFTPADGRQKKTANGESYREKLMKAYRAEKSVQGVSQEYYDNYRKILPAKRRIELDNVYQKQLRKELPPAYARKAAVNYIFTQYQMSPWDENGAPVRK